MKRRQLTSEQEVADQVVRDRDPFSMARAAVADALILTPDIRGPELAEALLNRGFDFQADLNELLARNFYISAFNLARRVQSAAVRAQLRLPGFEHLPLKVKTKKGKQIDLLDADYTRVRAYYRSLTKGHEARKKNDPRVIETKLVLDKMREPNRKRRGITVREVFAPEAKKKDANEASA